MRLRDDLVLYRYEYYLTLEAFKNFCNSVKIKEKFFLFSVFDIKIVSYRL